MIEQPEHQWEENLRFGMELYRLAVAVDHRASDEREQADSLSTLVRDCVPVRKSAETS
jgi:hypothetical protein